MLALMEAPSRRFQIPLRRGELDVAAAFRQFFPSHCLDDWPVLPNELRRILKILRLHFDTAGLPASATRYLEIERINRGLRIFPMRLNIPAHAVSPLYCVELGHLRFANLPFVRRECGVGRSDAPPVTQGNAADAFWGSENESRDSAGGKDCMVVAAGRTGKRAVTGTYSGYESCWLQISRRKLKGPRRVDKQKKTAIELEEIVKQRIGAGDFRVTVHRNPDSGWHATIYGRQPAEVHRCQVIADTIAVELCTHYELDE